MRKMEVLSHPELPSATPCSPLFMGRGVGVSFETLYRACRCVQALEFLDCGCAHSRSFDMPAGNWHMHSGIGYVGDCQNYGPFLGPLN